MFDVHETWTATGLCVVPSDGGSSNKRGREISESAVGSKPDKPATLTTFPSEQLRQLQPC